MRLSLVQKKGFVPSTNTIEPSKLKFRELAEIVESNVPEYIGCVIIRTSQNYLCVKSETDAFPAFGCTWGFGVSNFKVRVLSKEEALVVGN